MKGKVVPLVPLPLCVASRSVLPETFEINLNVSVNSVQCPFLSEPPCINDLFVFVLKYGLSERGSQYFI